ncbi:MAG: 3'-5' exonuclease [Myxococcota bacterium]|nr:3'-5' exonuclease [Myxococcota bacterium]
MQESNVRSARRWSEALILSFDLETTGPEPRSDRIVQFGAAYFDRGRYQRRHELLINPEIPIPKEASKVHFVTDDRVQGAPRLEDFIPKWDQHLNGLPVYGGRAPLICGYNILSFDIPLLRAQLKRIGAADQLGNRPLLDLFVFARWFWRSSSNKLTDLCERFQIQITDAHQASADARGCGELLFRLIESRIIPDEIDEAMRLQAHYKARLDEESARYHYWLYGDRQSGELFLGAGKHRGTPLAATPISYIDRVLSFSDLHEGARSTFEAERTRRAASAPALRASWFENTK